MAARKGCRRRPCAPAAKLGTALVVGHELGLGPRQQDLQGVVPGSSGGSGRSCSDRPASRQRAGLVGQLGELLDVGVILACNRELPADGSVMVDLLCVLMGGWMWSRALAL